MVVGTLPIARDKIVLHTSCVIEEFRAAVEQTCVQYVLYRCTRTNIYISNVTYVTKYQRDKLSD